MKNIGIIKKVDDLGRIVIPKEFRNVLDLEIGTPVEMLLTEDGIFIQKYNPCGNLVDTLAKLEDSINSRIDTETIKELQPHIEAIKSLIQE